MPRAGTIVSHWHTLIDNFNTSALDFYGAVEAAIKSRQVPELDFSTVTFKEGGFGSAKRLYLRIERRNVSFDLCAAPYGNSFFFSWWLSRLGPKHPLLQLVAFLFLVFVVPPLVGWPLRRYGFFIIVPLTFVLMIVGLATLARNGVFGPEENILGIPIIGWLYEKLFHPITYYTLDTALMFQEAVRRAVNDVIDGRLASQGLHILSENQLRPTIRDLAR